MQLQRGDLQKYFNSEEENYLNIYFYAFNNSFLIPMFFLKYHWNVFLQGFVCKFDVHALYPSDIFVQFEN